MKKSNSIFILHPSTFILFFILFSSFLVTSSFGEIPVDTAKEKKVTFNFVDVDISVVVKFISDSYRQEFCVR